MHHWFGDGGGPRGFLLWTVTPERSLPKAVAQVVTVVWLVAVAGAVCARPAAAQEAPADEVLPPEALVPGVPVERLPPELDQTWAYTTADPVRADWLGLATLDGRYAFQLSAGCSSSVWSVAAGQEVVLSVLAGRGARIAPLSADGDPGNLAFPIQVQERMSSMPCLVDARGACDVSQEMERP
jgi:hypothetical protein